MYLFVFLNCSIMRYINKSPNLAGMCWHPTSKSIFIHYIYNHVPLWDASPTPTYHHTAWSWYHMSDAWCPLRTIATAYETYPCVDDSSAYSISSSPWMFFVFLGDQEQTSQGLSQASWSYMTQYSGILSCFFLKDSGYDNQKTQVSDGRPHHFQHLGREFRNDQGGAVEFWYFKTKTYFWNINLWLP